VRTLDIVPLHEETPSEKRSGMTRIVNGHITFYIMYSVAVTHFIAWFFRNYALMLAFIFAFAE